VRVAHSGASTPSASLEDDVGAAARIARPRAAGGLLALLGELLPEYFFR
jgi:hypothetical protein